MRRWERAASINVACAVAFAAWCTAWLWALLEATRPYPGIFTSQGTRGAYELIELPTGCSSGTILAACFLAFLLPPLIFGMARSGLDPDREAWRATRWAFGSRSLNIAVLMLLAFDVLAISQRVVWQSDEIAVSIMIGAGLLGLVLPFFAWSTHTLSRASLSRWWLPGWPGLAALLMVIALQSLSAGAGWGIGLLDDAGAARWVSFLGVIADWLVDLFIWLLIAVIWLDRGEARAIVRHGKRVVRWPVLKLVIWQDLFVLLVVLALMTPFLLSTVLSIFVIPQLEFWARSRGENLPTTLTMIAAAGRAPSYLPFALVAMGAYPLLAQGKLLFDRGVGAGLDGPNR